MVTRSSTAAPRKAKAGAKSKKTTLGRATGAKKKASLPDTSGKQLVIVESPAKARTVGQILGRKFVVAASQGHIRDLPKGKMGVDLEQDFQPSYVTMQDKRSPVTSLKKAGDQASGIYLATDHWDVSVGDFFSGESHFIRVLQVKTVLAALVIILGLTHDFVLGPWVMNKLEAARATSGPPPVIPVKKMILMIARVNLIMVLGNPVPGGISDSTVEERFT